MAVKDYSMPGPVSDADEMHEIGFAGCDVESSIPRIVDQGTVRKWLPLWVVGGRLVLFNQGGHLLVVKIRQGKGKFIVIMKWSRLVMHEKGTT